MFLFIFNFKIYLFLNKTTNVWFIQDQGFSYARCLAHEENPWGCASPYKFSASPFRAFLAQYLTAILNRICVHTKKGGEKQKLCISSEILIHIYMYIISIVSSIFACFLLYYLDSDVAYMLFIVFWENHIVHPCYIYPFCLQTIRQMDYEHYHTD